MVASKLKRDGNAEVGKGRNSCKHHTNSVIVTVIKLQFCACSCRELHRTHRAVVRRYEAARLCALVHPHEADALRIGEVAADRLLLMLANNVCDHGECAIDRADIRTQQTAAESHCTPRTRY